MSQAVDHQLGKADGQRRPQQPADRHQEQPLFQEQPAQAAGRKADRGQQTDRRAAPLDSQAEDKPNQEGRGQDQKEAETEKQLAEVVRSGRRHDARIFHR